MVQVTVAFGDEFKSVEVRGREAGRGGIVRGIETPRAGGRHRLAAQLKPCRRARARGEGGRPRRAHDPARARPPSPLLSCPPTRPSRCCPPRWRPRGCPPAGTCLRTAPPSPPARARRCPPRASPTATSSPSWGPRRPARAPAPQRARRRPRPARPTTRRSTRPLPGSAPTRPSSPPSPPPPRPRSRLRTLPARARWWRSWCGPGRSRRRVAARAAARAAGAPRTRRRPSMP